VEENPEAKFLEDPRFFVKLSTAVIGPGEPIRWPGARFQVDYEVELAVVLGRVARRLTQRNALSRAVKKSWKRLNESEGDGIGSACVEKLNNSQTS
jgi:hypothetical protein